MALFQVIEWYNIADFATTTQLLTQTATSKSPIAESNTAGYTGTDGVYLSPFTSQATNVDAMTTPNAFPTAIVGGDNAITQIAGSMGTAVYLDKSTGVAQGQIRGVDSSYI